ncbi:MAG: haloacid dehalogenase-like hydrolase [Candidatus Faecousia sp.]|nr:haloacid dehalogenase-like hydrolase [Clostridiales bacterium]MDY6179506.1 haloacid dehalogenase-like hydrolase [Candidatus Faecousia sp.]
MKRILDCRASDFRSMGKQELLAAIAGAEGRTLACETIGSLTPMLGDVTNAEFAAAMGADILLLNLFDVKNPVIHGLPPTPPQNVIRKLRELTGRPIGINLEPVEQSLGEEGSMWALTDGRKATLENARLAADMGVNFLLLTGNPGIGVTNEAIVQTLRLFKQELGDRLILAAGKMHASGILSEGAEQILTPRDVESFAEAGADILLLPAPGTVPGITVEYARELVSLAHSLGMLTITAIGTSQEGADVATIRQIALMCKMTGTDIHHLGDAGYGGISLPENIQAYSVAIRGIRHTYRRMAASPNR